MFTLVISRVWIHGQYCSILIETKNILFLSNGYVICSMRSFCKLQIGSSSSKFFTCVNCKHRNSSWITQLCTWIMPLLALGVLAGAAERRSPSKRWTQHQDTGSPSRIQLRLPLLHEPRMKANNVLRKRPLWFGDSTNNNNLNQTSPWVYTVWLYEFIYCHSVSIIHLYLETLTVFWFRQDWCRICWFQWYSERVCGFAFESTISCCPQLFSCFVLWGTQSQQNIVMDIKIHQKFLDITKNTGWWFGTMEFYDFPYIGIISWIIVV